LLGIGGQHVNKTASAVRLTHLESGLVVQCQDEKSQHKNLAKALRVLKTRLYELRRSIEHEKRATERRTLVGSGDRSQRVRTYNFPQNRLTDHRINESFTLDQVMAGRLSLVIEATEQHARQQRKAAMEQSAKPLAT
jgi:peptide chain release factor 1